jgi:hypothetical protein
MLGNGRLEAKCQDGETRLGQIRGQMRKKVGGDCVRLWLWMGWERLPAGGGHEGGRAGHGPCAGACYSGLLAL